MPEQVPNKLPGDRPTNGWVQEISDRRQEAVQAVLRNFAISRQFLNDGTLSDSERLIRFYEGIAMSLQRTPSKKAFEEAESAFKAALRYGDTLPVSTASNPEQPPSRIKKSIQHPDAEALRRQAEYNLAVLYHRRAVQLREEVGAPRTSREDWGKETVSHDVIETAEKTEGPSTWARQIKTVRDLVVREFDRSPEEPHKATKSSDAFIEQAKALYANLIRELVDKFSTNLNQGVAALKHWDQVDLATYAAASVGRITLFVETVEHGGVWDSTWGAPNQDAAFNTTEQLLRDIIEFYPSKKRRSKLQTFTEVALPDWLHRLIYPASKGESSDLFEADESTRILENMLGQVGLARRRIAESRGGPTRAS